MLLDTVSVPLDEADGAVHGAFNVIGTHALLVLQHQVIVAVLVEATSTTITCVVTILAVNFNVVEKQFLYLTKLHLYLIQVCKLLKRN